MEDEYRFAKKGYEAYAAFTGGKTFDGRNMPTWDELPERIRDAWKAATGTAIKEGLAASLYELAEQVRP